MNIDRQPNIGISQSATAPASIAPPVKPTVMHIISVTLRPFGLNSPTSAVALGMMQPMGMPPMNRSHNNCSRFWA